MSHLTHPVKVPLVTIVTTKHHDTELHRAGCSHEAKALKVTTPMTPPTVDDGYEDDWYAVAPCARRAPKVAA